MSYDDASFDKVTSTLGVMFAPDHAAVARELARVTRPGGRSCWRAGHPKAGSARCSG
jgi:ubiquinone/menaquinone biosynthesis C-methylase UbiE